MASRGEDEAGRCRRGTPPTRRIVVLAYPDVQMLDVTGPLEIFAAASRLLARRDGADPGPPAYAVEIVAPEAGPVRTSSGLELVASRSTRGLRGPIDSLIVAGGEGSRALIRDTRTITWLRRIAPRPRRLASVCTGAFLLAEAGLLDGRRATTHWAYCEQLAERHPAVRVETDPIFVRDGRITTSAGVTAGIDLALALVEEDHGRALAREVARWMVVFVKRPGGQSQFSAQLASRLPESDRLRGVQAWIVEHPEADHAVESLARRAAMSPRHFARVFSAEVGTTPARFVERVRVEAARRELEESDAGVDPIASACGFGSAETMRRAFLRTLHVGPADYRSRFHSAGSPRDETIRLEASSAKVGAARPPAVERGAR
jgi:transcriptional regulator GlxA family with amidase domain